MSTLSRIAHDWAVRCFSLDHIQNRALRSLRTVEESIELCQALGVPKEKVLLAVDTVYSRPVGEPEQEIGGVLLTTVIMCESMHLEADELLERELRRVLQKSPEHFAKRNQEKLSLGLETAPADNHLVAPFAAGYCTRKNHQCATIGEGPCNGFPRPFIASSKELSQAAELMDFSPAKQDFERAYLEHGFTELSGETYNENFKRWAVAQGRIDARVIRR